MATAVQPPPVQALVPAPHKSVKTPWHELETDDARRKANKKLFEHFAVHKAGGLKMLDEAEVSRQRGVVWEMIKEVGNSLMDGRELANITLPIQLFEAKSFLEKMTEGWAYAPTYLTRAALTHDPLERFKNVITFVVAGIHLTPAFRKPFNPILGETYQARLSDGTEIYCEQTTHHPPASNWQVIGPNNLYHYHGRGLCSASARGNTLKGYQHGLNVVEFGDGTKITWTLPTLAICGALFGERTQHYEGALNFRDEKNKLSCDLVFNAEALGFLKSLVSKQKKPCDYMRGEITRLSDHHVEEKKKKKKEDKEVVCLVEGSWLTHLDFAGTRYWDVERDLPHLIAPVDDAILPSDCRYREDLVALLENDIPRGKECKLMLEERQRYDERLRTAHSKKGSPSKKKGKEEIILVVKEREPVPPPEEKKPADLAFSHPPPEKPRKNTHTKHPKAKSI
jgi:hypothetical protein